MLSDGIFHRLVIVNSSIFIYFWLDFHILITDRERDGSAPFHVCRLISQMIDALLLPFSWNLFSGLFPERTESPVCIIPIFNVKTSTQP